MTVNSGTINISCTQEDEGGEGLESKATLTINGGKIDIEAYDDCINASDHIEISGGTVFCFARGNDGIDSNGTLSISGGFIISSGTRAPEGGFDCDNSTFKITGGIIIGTGGSTSNPTSSVCTQRSIKYSSGSPESYICIENPNGDTILMYYIPAYVGSGGGPGGPGGGNQVTVLFSDPNITVGNGYTLRYGGTVNGGTNVNGYITGGTYSGGQTKTFNVNSMLTNVN
ncbi:carbohydrate-binding domain-containing protein [Odoribacter sp. OttesenSCG-928-L07]|nr:carbohydrate-binding domain-containing protein [Odoribacter sp. OttesenSCG-928-L07]